MHLHIKEQVEYVCIVRTKVFLLSSFVNVNRKDKKKGWRDGIEVVRNRPLVEPMRPKAECDCGGAKSYKSAENTIVKSGFFKSRTPHMEIRPLASYDTVQTHGTHASTLKEILIGIDFERSSIFRKTCMEYNEYDQQLSASESVPPS
jgi:hypothetical protein